MLAVKDYVINRNTMAIMTITHDEYRTKILEPNKIIYCRKTPSMLITEACLDGGSTYIGRKDAMKRMLRTSSKLPIPINPTNGIFFFPNKSPKESECNWFSFFHIKNYIKSNQDKSKTAITFIDHSTEDVDTSYSSISRQFCLTGLAVALVYKKALWHGEETLVTE
jgi:competence protein ComK